MAEWQLHGQARSAEQRLTSEQLDALSQLREEHFGIAAQPCEREEEQGFYRFERPRKQQDEPAFRSLSFTPLSQ